jgi:hypothetical protein
MSLDITKPTDSQQLPTFPALLRGILAQLQTSHVHYAIHFAKTGTLAVGTNVTWEHIAVGDVDNPPSIERVVARVKTAPTGATLIVDVLKNGVTIFTNTATRSTIPIGGNISSEAVPQIATLAPNDILSLNIAQVGSTIAGADLTVTITIKQVLHIA